MSRAARATTVVQADPEDGMLVGIALWMLFAFGVCVLFVQLLAQLGAPRSARIVLIALTFLYVGRMGHYALWPRTAPKEPSWAAGLVALVFMLSGSLLAWVPLAMLDPTDEAAFSASVVFVCYVLLWMLRSYVAGTPRVRAARPLLWFLAVVYVGVGSAHAYGLEVSPSNVDAFHTTVAQVDAALLLAAAFQSAWARRTQALEGMVLITFWALALSLTCSLVVLGKGADSATLLALAVSGLGAGFVVVGIAVVKQVAPELLEDQASSVRQAPGPLGGQSGPHEHAP